MAIDLLIIISTTLLTHISHGTILETQRSGATTNINILLEWHPRQGIYNH